MITDGIGRHFPVLSFPNNCVHLEGTFTETVLQLILESMELGAIVELNTFYTYPNCDDELLLCFYFRALATCNCLWDCNYKMFSNSPLIIWLFCIFICQQIADVRHLPYKVKSRNKASYESHVSIG